MSLRTTIDIGRIARNAVSSIRHASVSAAPTEASNNEWAEIKKIRKETHGASIYVYSHLQTKQVVYSFAPTIRNSRAIKQISFNGKKTVPAAIRKDHWYPMAHIEFSPSLSNSPSLGLYAYQKLREYRRLHELQWPEEEMAGLTRKERGRKLCDQRANSVADMAAALALTIKYAAKPKLLFGRKPAPDIPVLPEIVATVRWSDLLDAEFAEKWPKAVVHDLWETTRDNRGLKSQGWRFDGSPQQSIHIDELNKQRAEEKEQRRLAKIAAKAEARRLAEQGKSASQSL